MTATATSPWLTAREAAAYARTSPERIYEACATGALSAVKPDPTKRGRWLTTTADVDDWLNRQRLSAEPLRRGRRKAAS